MLQTTTNSVNNGSYTYTSTATAYEWWDGAVQKQIVHDSNTNSGSNPLWYTTFTLNGFGQATYADILDGKPRSVTFKLDELGQILRRDETRPSQAPASQVGSPHEVWYRLGEREWGYTGNNGTLDISASSAIDQRRLYRAPASTGTFRNGAMTAAPTSDFTRGLGQLNTYNQGSGAGGYTVRNGDTLQSIAQGLYGDASLWYKIAEVNGLSSASASLTVGSQIQLPAGVTRNTYNSKTYTPYDPANAMGDLSPTTPKKPPKCGMMGMILLAAIAIAVVAVAGPAIIGSTAVLGANGAVVTAATGLTAALGGTAAAAGSLAAIGAGVIGGAVAGALGSVVSQVVGVTTGLQDKFSWKGVGMAALGGGIGGGLSGSGLFGQIGQSGAFEAGKLGIKSGIVDAAVRGASSSALTQGIGKATGLQEKFSWAGVAAAGVGSAVGYGLGGKLDALKTNNTINNHLSHAGANMASAMANAATRSAIEGSSFGRNLVAALPDVIGQAVFDAVRNGVVVPRPRIEYSPLALDEAAAGRGSSAEPITVLAAGSADAS